ncbi:FadR/GntR family transcriptional regulator [Secundilactobacillus hailunensis]|uniref:FadR/GntR family transcriptional regulator n=1 Tax=Secundilactobacillus hailunensis TaxID=2559923 RepID=A0ABW1TCH2_9LACO|nr:GntR family transcriptional regulator [Secundilactobacillus hailunensis]
MKFKPIEAPSATDLFVTQIKNAIIAGQLKPGEKLPHERELSETMNVSRSVINTGLSRLQQLHFIHIQPRQGAIVADYRSEGTLETLNQVVSFDGGYYQPSLLQSIYEFRQVTEENIVTLAAKRQDKPSLRLAQTALDQFKQRNTLQEWSLTTFDFFHALALASQNQVYPLIINSFRPMYLKLAEWNSKDGGNTEFIKRNQALLDAISDNDEKLAVELDHSLIEWSFRDLMRA